MTIRDQRRLEAAKEEWRTLEYGMFIHFGPNSIQEVAWGDGNFDLQLFNPPDIDIEGWAGLAAEAGMRYAVLTAKHHDGFCLWPTRQTDYSVAATPYKKDIVGTYVEEFRKAGLKTGLYYSLWDLNYPGYRNDKAYVEFMVNQLTELLSGYGDVLELWFDGAWDKDNPGGQVEFDPAWESDESSGLLHGERWGWQRLYETIHRFQPGCLVLNNSGCERPGKPRYLPVDLRTVERMDVIFNDELMTPPDSPWHLENDDRHFLPLEFCDTLTPDWFWRGEYRFGVFTHHAASAIAEWRHRARIAGGNMLLNIGPDREGRMPSYHRHFLVEADRIYSRG